MYLASFERGIQGRAGLSACASEGSHDAGTRGAACTRLGFALASFMANWYAQACVGNTHEQQQHLSADPEPAGAARGRRRQNADGRPARPESKRGKRAARTKERKNRRAPRRGGRCVRRSKEAKGGEAPVVCVRRRAAPFPGRFPSPLPSLCFHAPRRRSDRLSSRARRS